MNNLPLFLLKSTLILSLLYLTFSVLMRKETFFNLNRMLLLFMVLCSLLIPFLYSPQLFQPIVQVELEPISLNPPVLEVPVQVVDVPVAAPLSQPVEETAKPVTLSASSIFSFVYLSGVFVSFLLLVYSICSVLKLFQNARKVDLDGIRLMVVADDISAFSFGRNILISQHDYDTNSGAIITHEQSHIRMGHFYDLMLMELVKIIFWFNPLVYRMVRDLKEIHEFQADEHTLNSGIDASQYQLLIIQKCVGHQKFALANSFNHCRIKNRIVMMNKQKAGNAWRWKVATFLPLLALLLIFCGRKGANETSSNSFRFNNKLLKLDQCEIANESFDLTPKFEIDLLGETIDENSNLQDTTKVKHLIWLSISPVNNHEMADGSYKYSSLSPNNRPKMTFSGAVFVGSNKMKITDGDFIFNQDSDKIKIIFNLKVNSLNEIKGSYSGHFAFVNRIHLNQPPDPKFNSQEAKAGSVYGQVVLPDGRPLQRAVVRIEGTDKRAITDNEGRFILQDVPKEAVLEISNVGLNLCHVKPDFENSMNIKMEPASFWIDRVRVVGRVSENTTPKRVIGKPLAVSYGAAGQVSDTTTPKPLPKNSFTSNVPVNPPLFVVNGVIADKSKIDMLEPDDLASVNVLTGKSATDKYGSLANNGAMEITTKKKVVIPTDDLKDIVEVNEYAVNQNMDLHHNNVIDEMPEFIGGMKELMKFIADNIKYPFQAKTEKVQGNVEVNFVINQNGKVEQVRLVKEANPALDAEAVRVISSMPDWNPGKQGGKPVDVSFTFPIQFALK